MTGPQALWNVWRAALPQDKQIQILATRRMRLWAKALDPDFVHSEHVAHLALELYDGLTSAGLLASPDGTGVRSSLFLAALLHDVGKSKKKKGHHKASLELIKSHGTPLGWTAQDMQRAAIVARFHTGALPTRNHKAMRDLLPPEQKTTIQLAAILRLANALDTEHNGHIRNLRVEKTANGSSRVPSGCVVVTAEGYSQRNATARVVAGERHLLETILHGPVLIKPVKPAMRPGPPDQN
jgi:exopolyphosphatase/pppGpp-phosphohydrolase